MMRDKRDKTPAKSSKTDALRAQREAQHRELLDRRKARESGEEETFEPIEANDAGFPEWKKACEKYAAEKKYHGLSTMWLDLATEATTAFAAGTTPSVFVEGVFG